MATTETQNAPASIDIHTTYTYCFPTPVRFGVGVIEELGGHLRDTNKNAALLVTDPHCSDLPFFRGIVTSLRERGLSVEVFTDIHKNPIKSDIEKGAKLFRESGCDAVVGVGGGASLDVAKAVALMAHHGGDLFDYEDCKGGEKLVTGEIPYMVCVPTTSGTGSEVGRSAVISDDDTHEKKIIFSPRLMPKLVLADPGLTIDLPPSITAATGIDALTHNIEAYLSKGYHPLCDGIALEGIRLAWENLEKATKHPTLEARSHMMMAALMGAVAFQKGLGIVHSMAHPLSTLYDIHHGLACAVMLPFGLRFNADVCGERYSMAEKIIDSSDLLQSIRSLCERLQLPAELGTLGVKEADLDKLSSLAFTDVCHLCNPKPVSQADFRTLYQEAL